MSRVANWINNTAYHVDAAEAETKVREKYPLLLHPEETVELAFKSTADHRDKCYFTSHRILVQDGKGVGTKRKSYLSIPYWSIQAFIIQTSGVADCDAELKIYKLGDGYQRIDFSTKSVDIYSVAEYINCKMSWANVSGTEDYVEGTPPKAAFEKGHTLDTLIDILGENAKQLEPAIAEQTFKTDFPVLLEDEKVGLAFKTGRDTCLFTDKRCMFIDVQGVFGAKISFASYPWRAFSAFAVQTPGPIFDRDTEMTLYTNLEEPKQLCLDFHKHKVDLMAVQKFLSNKILGEDTAPVPDIDLREEQGDDDKTSWWFRDNQRPIDAVEMDRHYHTEVPILQGSEQVEFAFKGRRDIILFTTKRIIDINPKGLTGTRIEYTSIPWKSIVAFDVETAGAIVDQNSEVHFWTDMMFESKAEELELKKLPAHLVLHHVAPTVGSLALAYEIAAQIGQDPGMSLLELDFDKRRVDVIVLKKYLSVRLLGETPHVPISPTTFMTSTEGSLVDQFISMVGDDHRAIDPTELNKELHSTVPILLDHENIVMAFKAGRDVAIFTDRRVLYIDTQGLTGQKVSYWSVPYTSIRGFSAQSAGAFDTDSELYLYTGNRWNEKFAFDFHSGKANIIAIQKFLAAVVLEDHEEAAQYLATSSSAVEKLNPATSPSHFVSWMLDNAFEIDAEKANDELHTDSPILLTNERVIRAYKQGRDTFVYTTHRFLVVDVQGALGKKIEYKSLPFKYGAGFEVETAGHMDRDAEVYLLFEIPEELRVKQSILVKTGNILELQQFLVDTFLFKHIPEFGLVEL